MAFNDYRVAAGCTDDYNAVLDFVSRSVFDTTVGELAAVRGDGWVQEVCDGTKAVTTVSPPPLSGAAPSTLPEPTAANRTPTQPPNDRPDSAEDSTTKTVAIPPSVTRPANPTTPALSLTTSATSPPKPFAALQDTVAPLRQMALDTINERRRQLGVAPMKLGNSVAAELHADQSLANLELLDVTERELSPEMLYAATGGRGYIRWSGRISGYWDESSIIDCGSRLVICESVVPDKAVSSYLNRGIVEDLADGGEGLVSPEWSKLHLGIAYTELTIVIVEYIERQGLDYIREPTIGGGFLSLEVRPKSKQNVEVVQVFQHRLSADNSSQTGESKTKVLSIFESPRSGYSVVLSSDISVVADYWADDGESIQLAVALEGRLPGLGTYEFVIWTEQEVPASQYFIRVDDPKVLLKDLTDRPFETPERPSMESLRLLALDLINIDRERYGAPPVTLGTNDSAQLHAEDALKAGYLVGHWTADGRKPYMLYRLAGGTGTVAENAAGSGLPPGACEEPRVVCGLVDPVAKITEPQWAMMYDDGDSDWGHRDTIISPNYDTANIGITSNDHRLAFYQHFEYNGSTHVEEPVLDGDLLRLRPRPLAGHGIGHIAMYYDPPPTPKSPAEIDLLTSYCTGGGFTDDCDDVGPIAVVLKPPTSRSYYSSLDPEDIVALTWNERSDGSIDIEADLHSLVDRPGVYVIIVQSSLDDRRILSGYSVFR